MNPDTLNQAPEDRSLQKLEARHIELAGGEHSESALFSKLESMGYHCTRYTYPPGTVFPDHSHATDKIDAVLAGCLRITTEHEQLNLRAGDFVLIPAGVIHRAEVIGEEAVVSLDGVKDGS